MTEARDSLTDRLSRGAVRVARKRPTLSARDARVAAALAGAVALGPLLTIVGANLLRADVEAENRVLEARLRVRLAPQTAHADAATVLRDAVRRPAMSVTLEQLARALPDDARLVSAARDAQGRLLFEVSTTDPDALRGALRGQPGFAAMRETGQRRTADARVVVTLRSVG